MALAKLEAAYVNEAVAACKAEGAGYDNCQALDDIRAKYKARRQAYVECHQ